MIALSEEMQARHAHVVDIGPAAMFCPSPDPAALTRMRALLEGAERPLAILGGSGWSEAGRTAIGAFLHASGLPVCVGFRRQALYDNTADNYVGDLGVGADPALVAHAREADVVLAIGTRLGEPVTQGYTLFGPGSGATIIHVHSDAAEIGRVCRPALGIVSDPNAFARAVSAMPPMRGGWQGWTRLLRTTRQAGREVPDYDGPLNLGHVMRELEALLPDDAILTTDAGNFATWAPRFIDFSDRQRYIGPTSGAMGYGVPAAVAASIAFPERRAVCFVGDGGFLMTGQEIATAMHHGAAPIVLVFDNAMYGTIRMYQERAFPGRVSGTALTNPDFAALARAFGAHGETVAATAEFAPAFGRAAASGLPSVIHLRMNPAQITTRTTL